MRGVEVAAESAFATLQWHELRASDLDLARARCFGNSHTVRETLLLASSEVGDPVRLIVEDVSILLTEAHVLVVLIIVLQCKPLLWLLEVRALAPAEAREIDENRQSDSAECGK